MATPELIDLLRKPNLNVREYVEEVLRANREAGLAITYRHMHHVLVLLDEEKGKETNHGQETTSVVHETVCASEAGSS